MIHFFNQNNARNLLINLLGHFLMLFKLHKTFGKILLWVDSVNKNFKKFMIP